jgi:hypothetical protein
MPSETTQCRLTRVSLLPRLWPHHSTTNWRGLKSVDGGRLASGISTLISLTDSCKQQIVRSRFQEVDRDSASYNAMPSGSHVKTEELGELSILIPDPTEFLDRFNGDIDVILSLTLYASTTSFFAHQSNSTNFSPTVCTGICILRSKRYPE